MVRKELIKAIAYFRTSSAANVGEDKDTLKRQREAVSTFAKAAAYEIIAETLKSSGLPGPEEFVEGTWLDCAQPFETAHFLDGFGHLDKKFHFRANWRSVAGPMHDRDLGPLP